MIDVHTHLWPADISPSYMADYFLSRKEAGQEIRMTLKEILCSMDQAGIDRSIVLNPVGLNFGARTPLSVAVSRDGGFSWQRLCDLQTEPGEFSYPAIVNRGNRVYITHTWKRENIAYWEFEWHP